MVDWIQHYQVVELLALFDKTAGIKKAEGSKIINLEPYCFKHMQQNYRLVKYFTAVFLIVSFSCGQKKSENRSTDTKESLHTQSKPPSSSQDSLYITQLSAVFFEPDPIQFEKLKSITEKRAFETNVHEYFFQFRNATAYLQEHFPHVKIISAKNFRYVVFQSQGLLPATEVIDLDRVSDAWGMYFFKPLKQARLIDMMSVDTEAPNYFSK